VSSTEFNVGLIGYGLGGRVFHAPFVTTVPGLHLAAIVTANAERAAQATERYPETTVLASVDDLWARTDLDLVIVCTPNRTHVPLATEAIGRGLNVVVDKPLAGTAAEAARLVALAQERGVLLSVFQNRRWDSDLLTLQRVLATGTLGRVMRFESRFERWSPTARPGWKTIADPAEYNSLLYDLGAHLIDQALYLFGPVESVYAEMARQRAGEGPEDDVFVALTHRSGVRAHLWANALAAQFGPRLRVLGDQAAFVAWGLDPQEPALAEGALPYQPGYGVPWGEQPPTVGVSDDASPVAAEAGAYQRYYEGMVTALRGEGPVPVDPNDAVASLAVIEAAAASARSGQVVTLPAR
jgi:scyllo-inositol 2-dehydrogenase (NADP+)